MPAPVAPSHVNAASGIDLDTVCTCQRPYVTMSGPCPCRCHIADRHRTNIHAAPVDWCPACRAIAAQTRSVTP